MPHSKKYYCPGNGLAYVEVSAKTISHHIRQPWKWKDEGIRYFFCSDPNCDVVYFGDDDSIITKNQLRTTVGVKETSNDAPACYCFGVSKADAINDPGIREYVMNQTKNAQCSCEVSNPSGRCCLKDFPRTDK
ncbi:MAG: hypothetical protein WC236_09385 [Gallionellaceae bacterium]|jgi:hypothetical protein